MTFRRRETRLEEARVREISRTDEGERIRGNSTYQNGMKESPKRWRGKPPRTEPILVVVEPTPVSISATPPPVTVPVTAPPARVEQSKWMIVATVVMALTSLVMLGVTMHMARTSLHQWEAMREQAEQTNNVLKQMKADHEAAKTQATDVINQMKEDRDLVKEQVKQNKAVLEQMQLEQRAWVSVTGQPTIELEANKMLRWLVQLRNTGQTPALVERIEWLTTRHPLGADFDPKAVRLIEHGEGQRSVAPDAIITFPFMRTPAITQATYDSIKGPHRTHRLYLIGTVHYRDVANVKRYTEFCLFYDADANDVRTDTKHNRMT